MNFISFRRKKSFFRVNKGKKLPEKFEKKDSTLNECKAAFENKNGVSPLKR